MNLIYTAIALFALAAILGMYLISFVLRSRETPKAFAFIHGMFAATALVLLIIHAVKTDADVIEAIVLFIIAALGGLVMIIRDLSGKSVPKPLAIVHGLLAVSGFIFLLVHTFSK